MISRIQALINNFSVPKIVIQHPVAFSLAVLLHLALFIGLLFSNIQNIEQNPLAQVKKNSSRVIPKAVTVDLSEINKEKQRLVDHQKKKHKREQRRLRELEDQRYQKQRKINKLKAKAKKEQQAIEKQRQAEAKKFKEEQKKRELAKAAELKAAQKIKAERQRILDELKVNYIAQIASRVHSQWRYGGAKDDWACVVDIVQDKEGNVKKVELDSCYIDDKSKETSFKNSIIRAVNKASPLPGPPDASIFDPEVKFKFKVNE